MKLDFQARFKSVDYGLRKIGDGVKKLRWIIYSILRINRGTRRLRDGTYSLVGPYVFFADIVNIAFFAAGDSDAAVSPGFFVFVYAKNLRAGVNNLFIFLGDVCI